MFRIHDPKIVLYTIQGIKNCQVLLGLFDSHPIYGLDCLATSSLVKYFLEQSSRIHCNDGGTIDTNPSQKGRTESRDQVVEDVLHCLPDCRHHCHCHCRWCVVTSDHSSTQQPPLTMLIPATNIANKELTRRADQILHRLSD